MTSFHPPSLVQCAIAAFLVIALCFSHPLRSQIFPQDVRLSVDPVQSVLPGHAQIQSAARIGDLTLVVWGSTRAVSDDSAANVLYWQAIQDTVKLGAPQILTSPEAFPYDYVQVVPLENRFLVVWNDKREGRTNSYSRIVDVGGSLRTEELFSAGSHIDPPGVFALRRTDEWVLLWSDLANRSILGKRLDAAGSGNPAVSRIADGAVVGVVDSIANSSSAIVDRADDPPLLLDRDGMIPDLPQSIAAKFRDRYHIAPDGSVLALLDSALYEYRTVYDTVPARWRPLPVFDSVGENPIVFVGHDIAGGQRLLYVDVGCAWFQHEAERSRILSFTSYSIAMKSDSTFISPVKVAGTHRWIYFHVKDHPEVKCTSPTVRRVVCDDVIEIKMHLEGTTRRLNHQTMEYEVKTVDVNEYVYFQLDGTEAPFEDTYDSALTTHRRLQCQSPRSAAVVRIPDGARSSVALDIGSTAIRLSAPAAIVNSPTDVRYAERSRLRATLAPNPARGYLSITLSEPAGHDDRVELFDALGRRVRSLELARGDSHVDLDLEGVSVGAYIVQIRSASGIEYHRIAVVR